MKHSYWASLIIAIPLFAMTTVVFGDNDDEGFFSFFKRQPGVAPVSNQLYKEECGSCHFAYQPGWLPQRSWQHIMSNLGDHYGDNAELNQADQKNILDYLANTSADNSDYRRSKKIMRSLDESSAPQRISELRYIKHEHDEIPQRLVTKNDKVVSLSYCDACHQDADKGSFSERQIKIPGYGAWDD